MMGVNVGLPVLDYFFLNLPDNPFLLHGFKKVVVSALRGKEFFYRLKLWNIGMLEFAVNGLL
jgi:hypothetical protein